MNILKLGWCHHSVLPMEKHVKNAEITRIALRLWRVKAIPDEPPALHAIRKRELEAILKNTRRCLGIIINSPEVHNFNKITRLDHLVEKTYSLILDEQFKDDITESDSEMSLCESEREIDAHAVVSSRTTERERENRTRFYDNE